MYSRYNVFTGVVFVTLLLCGDVCSAESPTRWAIDDNGGITWAIRRGQAHEDHIEMSGKSVSVIVTYGVHSGGALTLKRQVVFPMLRLIPNNTHANLIVNFGEDSAPQILLNRASARNEIVNSIRHKGIIYINGMVGRNGEVGWTRTIFPSADKPLVIEKITYTNHSSSTITLELEHVEKIVRTAPTRGVYGGYVASSEVLGEPGEQTVRPGESVTYYLVFSARRSDEGKVLIDAQAEEQARKDRVESFLSKLRLETPDRVLNTAFAFAKIRATESIYNTRGGLMHGPGGGRYYAAIWANDQAEYANPFFPFLGDDIGNESAINSFRHFARFMNPDYRPIPSSIIAEGVSYWNGAGDRGDMAMIAYGAGRFALAYGDKKTAEELWPLIEWCLEYCRRRLNDDGVVASDSDELENRFPAGEANLCTSSLYYDALNSAVMLGRELGKAEVLLGQYEGQAKTLCARIETYFGGDVEGFDTYRYYKGNTVLRSWICIPLTVGILDRAEATIAALFSPRLWTPDGLATQAGSTTFWDRSTLYGLRGVFEAGALDKGLDYLTYYSGRRLLGDHVPYPVEAYPEGNQRHLSAESALYCRIFIEGMFGIRPTGLQSFTCTPRLPKDWPAMSLRNIRAFGNTFDLTVTRTGENLRIEVIVNDEVVQAFLAAKGQAVVIDLNTDR